MMAQVYRFLILTLSLSLLLSCSEDEKELESSPNLLIMVSKSSYTFVDLESNNTIKKEQLEEVIRSSLKDYKAYFQKDYIYEMKTDDNKSFDGYKSRKDYDKGIKYLEGSYAFSDESKDITFTVENEQTVLTLDGSLSDMIYNHFTRKEGEGKHHEILGGTAFCLNDDLTVEFQEKYKDDYPEVEIKEVLLKTDIVTIRPLESFK